MKKQQNKHTKGIKDFDVKINEAGEIEYSITIDEVNKYLDKHVPDKKLISRKEFKQKS